MSTANLIRCLQLVKTALDVEQLTLSLREMLPYFFADHAARLIGWLDDCESICPTRARRAISSMQAKKNAS